MGKKNKMRRLFNTIMKETKTHKKSSTFTKTKNGVTLGAALLFLFGPLISHAASFDYKLLEDFPGVAGMAAKSVYTDLPGMIKALYNFGIWTVGIAALFMIIIGGFMYMTSAGNTSRSGSAKAIIGDAFLGLIAALGAYLLLYVINPDLTKINLNLMKVDVSSPAGGGTPGPTPPGPGGKTCNDGTCTQIDSATANNSSGIDPSLLKSILVGGEGCNKALSGDGHNSCGYSQALPSIRAWCGIPGSQAESCSAIQNDVQLDVNCAAKLIASNQKRCGSTPEGAASCYNSGKPNNCAKCTNNYCGRVRTFYNSCSQKQ